MRRHTFLSVVAAVASVGLASSDVTAQPYFYYTPYAFVGATRSYTLQGCGNGRLTSDPSAPQMTVFCLAGTATVGTARDGAGNAVYQTVLDLTGTRQNGFAGVFIDADYSSVDLFATYTSPAGTQTSRKEGFGIPADLTGHHTFGYSPLYPFGAFAPNGIAYGEPARAVLEYVLPDGPMDSDHAHYFPFSLTVSSVSAVPEPATLALTLGGLVVLGTAAWRRRRA